MGLCAGDKVMIVGGPFAGLNGVFEAANGSGRVLVLLDLLGRSVPSTDVAPQS
jgi:transcription antitermination factor NusG